MHITWEQIALISAETQAQLHKKLFTPLNNLTHALEHKSCFTNQSPFTFATVPFDIDYQNSILNAAAKIKKAGCDGVILVGIGGSNLGTMAVHTTLSGLFPTATTPQLYCADTIGGDESAQLFTKISSELANNKKLHLVIISKSGSTLETAINAALYIELFKKQFPQNYASQITVVTEEQSLLWRQSEKEGFNRLALPKTVGGRYSVFTAVGLFPLALLGHDIQALCKGAQDTLANTAAHTNPSIHFGSAKTPFDTTLRVTQGMLRVSGLNTAATRATILYHWYTQGLVLHDSFFFDSSCELLGKWYRQLLAESTGKKLNIQGTLVETGITPTVSIGTTDLHSLFQLSIGGPRIKGTTFYNVEQNNTTIASPHLEGAPAAGITLANINTELQKSAQTVYLEDQRPFMTITFKKTALDLGALLQTHLLEVALLGTLLEINPFDQPEVERYKTEAKKLLKL